MNDNIMVTVVCLTYNHEKYIRKALDGFVMQKTNFRFKVLVHDDASTDETASIIREYEHLYDFISPIYQNENQYSKGPFGKKYIYPNIEGKYVAFCEGDDYWIDENKLQIMFDFLEEHSDFSSCCHAYNNVIANSEKKISTITTLRDNGVITAREAIMYNNPPQLASQMFRTDVVITQPELFLGRGVGDYTLLLYSLSCGKIYYINRIMACHRVMSDGSWSQRVFNNKSKKIAHIKDMMQFLYDYNGYTKGEYDQIISEKVAQLKFNILVTNNDYVSQKQSDLFEKCSNKRKMIINLGILVPKIAEKLEKHLR